MRSDLIAAGNDPLVSNRSGGAPNTVISPSLLFGELEVKRADTSKDKLPQYPAPPLSGIDGGWQGASESLGLRIAKKERQASRNK